MNLEQLFDVRGKIGVITGGGGALAGTLADALAGLGARVAVLDLSQEKAETRAESIRTCGGQAHAFACDVLEAGALEEVRAKIEATWGPPDFLINGAGGNSPKASTSLEFLEGKDLDRNDLLGFFDMRLSDFQETFQLNFAGTLIPTRVFARSMVKRGSGSILNIASVAGLVPLTKVVAYSAAKAAVANFTRWLAVHFSRTGVRVNALAPGFFFTEQLKFLHVDPKTGDLTPRARKTISHTPVGRYGESEELIGAAVWLLSSTSRFVTGSVVPVDGGFSSYSI